MGREDWRFQNVLTHPTVYRVRRSLSQSEPASTLQRRGSSHVHTIQRTKHCWQNYVDYHKCILAKGEDFKPCRQVIPKFKHAE